jgi:hypothetical protein
MPPKRQTLSRDEKKAMELTWGVARRSDKWRYDKVQESYVGRYCFSIRPSKADRGFRSSVKKMTNVQLWDSNAKSFQVLAVPQAYIIHIWWIQMQAKFWRETAKQKTRARIGVYLTWLVDEFAKEVLEDNEGRLMVPEWNSQVLHGIICRSFFHIIEEDIRTDFDVALQSARTACGDQELGFTDLKREDFDQIYDRWDVMSDDLREGTVSLCIL